MKDIETVIKRSRRYWYVDGITELYMGSISVLAGFFYLGFEGVNALVSFLFGPPIANPSFFYKWLAMPLLISYFILFSSFFWLTLFLQRRATKFRESFTYSRIGYLAPRTSKRAPNLILATIFIGIQLLLAYQFIIPFGVFNYISPNLVLFGGCLFFSCLYLYPAISSALTRFYILSAFSTLLSIVLFQTSIRPGMNMILYTILMGVALVVAGGLTFRNFLRHNPLPQEELVTADDLENADQDIDEPMTNEEIMDVIKRSPYYWFMDGIAELGIGGQWLSFGIYGFSIPIISPLAAYSLYRPLVLPPSLQDSPISVLQPYLFLILNITLACSILIIVWLQKKLRKRFFNPQLSYLMSRIPASRQRLKTKTFTLISIPFLLVPMLIFMIMSNFVPPNLTVLVVSLSFSFVFLPPAVSLALNRFYILTALSVLLSIILFKISINSSIQTLLYITLMGVALIISGALTFRNFLRKYPLPKEELE